MPQKLSAIWGMFYEKELKYVNTFFVILVCTATNVIAQNGAVSPFYHTRFLLQYYKRDFSE